VVNSFPFAHSAVGKLLLPGERRPPQGGGDLGSYLFFRKEQDSSFSEEKEAKRLLSVGHGVPRSGTWPENGLLINSLAEAGWGER
jgi:hypothetical protein